MEASEPKCVNPVLDIIGVNSLRLTGLHMTFKGIICFYYMTIAIKQMFLLAIIVLIILGDCFLIEL